MKTAGAYEEYTEDAFKLLETYYTESGYSNYGANADSTALALAAYSLAGNTEKAGAVYDILIKNFYDTETGGFKADYDEYYATADAVFALSFYMPIAEEDKQESTTAPETTTQAQTTTAADSNNSDASKKSPATGVEIAPAIGAAAVALMAFAAAAKKKKA